MTRDDDDPYDARLPSAKSAQPVLSYLVPFPPFGRDSKLEHSQTSKASLSLFLLVVLCYCTGSCPVRFFLPFIVVYHHMSIEATGILANGKFQYDRLTPFQTSSLTSSFIRRSCHSTAPMPTSRRWSSEREV
jgi:hypothetical protein